MGADSRAKWNKRAKRYQELFQGKGPSAADEYRKTFHNQAKFQTEVTAKK